MPEHARSRQPDPEDDREPAPGGRRAVRLPVASPHEADARYWDEVADSVARARPDPLWRHYSDRVNGALLRAWLPDHGGTLLKTDLFDEAWTGGFLWDPEQDGSQRAGAAVGIDTSPVVAARALARHPGAPAVGADVRHLPFRDASFRAVISPSTLDHFADRSEIFVALREIHRILAPGSHVVVTLDNPLHPLVALRGLGLGLWRRLGLIPYRLGVTLRPAELAAALEAAGFEVLRRGAVQHFPRIALIALDRLIGRRVRARSWLLRRAVAQERLGRFSTKYLTGQFIAVLARRPVRPSEGSSPDSQAPPG